MSTPDDAKRWDEIHKNTHTQTAWHSQFAEEKERLFARGSVVVDLGGGSGADALYILSKGHAVVVFDISEFALEVIKKKATKVPNGNNLEIRQIDFGLHKLPLKDNSADVVYSRISLNYFGNNHTTEIFRDIFKSLKPGGSAYLTFKSPEDLNEMELLKKSATEYEPNVYIDNGQLRSRFTKEQLEKMLQNAGITNYSVKPYQEDLSSQSQGTHATLFQNEVIFTKPS